MSGESTFIGALQGHSGKNLDVPTLSLRKIEKGFASLLSHIGSSRDEDSATTGGLLQGGFGQSKGRKTVYFSFVSPLDSNPNPKYKPHFHLKKQYDLMFVIDLEAAQNSRDFYQTANGSILCYDAVPVEFLTKNINIKDGAERFVKAQSKERKSPPTMKSRRDRNTLEKSQVTSQKTKNHSKRDSSENF